MRIICVNTGKKFGPWYTKNLKHMIDTYSGLKYDEFCEITQEKHQGVFNKLQMFDLYRDGENLFFDLDIVIRKSIPNLVRKDLTILHAWWRDEWHTPTNSSIISWTGDYSHIYQKFLEQTKYYEETYHKGIDEFMHKHVDHKLYDKVCNSIQGHEQEPETDDWAIWLFNQRYFMFEQGWSGWWRRYLISNTA